MSQFTRIFAVCGLLAMCFVGTTDAQRPRPLDRQGLNGGGGFGKGSPLFAALDSDKDGRLSTEEIAAAGESLKSLDKNEDGVITKDELMPKGGRGKAGKAGGERAERGERGKRCCERGNRRDEGRCGFGHGRSVEPSRTGKGRRASRAPLGR